MNAFLIILIGYGILGIVMAAATYFFPRPVVRMLYQAFKTEHPITGRTGSLICVPRQKTPIIPNIDKSIVALRRVVFEGYEKDVLESRFKEDEVMTHFGSISVMFQRQRGSSFVAISGMDNDGHVIDDKVKGKVLGTIQHISVAECDKCGMKYDQLDKMPPACIRILDGGRVCGGNLVVATSDKRPFEPSKAIMEYDDKIDKETVLSIILDGSNHIVKALEMSIQYHEENSKKDDIKHINELVLLRDFILAMGLDEPNSLMSKEESERINKELWEKLNKKYNHM